jgi:DNA transformation protein
MAVSDDYLTFVKDLLEPFGPLGVKRMFGGAGIYAGERMFAIAVDDALYLKADDANRGDFERAGLAPFSHTRKDGKVMTLSYYPPPADALEDPERLAVWVAGALAAAAKG